ncbi:uncharacterized protein Dana_GF21185 [Drosophila ananassae]|uniref:Uncharacterized protein n=1 Tax=Drosophila ananassae TaxID=7217 RepID=B3MQZ6_DROAN|nr:uncharacterized protein LOC6503870 [Drosophila ananassae]EDV34201.1 uncharacterized protein Dana_GF21185 [Drosophila ananassae]
MVVDKLHPLDDCQLFADVKEKLNNYSMKVKNLSLIPYISEKDMHTMGVCCQVQMPLIEHDLIVLHKPPTGGLFLVAECVGPEAKNHFRGLFAFLLVNSASPKWFRSPKWGPQCAHLKQLPMLPQCLTVAIYLRCAMSDVLEEFLACGPRWLTQQYFETVDQVMTEIYYKHSDVITRLWSCLRAAGDAIVFRNIAEANDVLIPFISSMLKRHLVFEEEEFCELHPTYRKAYLAEAMTQMIGVVLRALDEKVVGRPKPSYFAFYSQLGNDLSDSYQPDPRPDLRRFAKVVLDALQRVLYLVPVINYLDWVESGSPRQEHVCSLSKELLGELEKPENAELARHFVCGQLKPFAEIATLEQPLTASIGELLNYLDGKGEAEPSEEEKVVGLSELFSRSIAFGNDECVATMRGHLELLTVEHGRIIIEYLGQVVLARQAEKRERLAQIMNSSDEKPYIFDLSETVSDDDDDDEEEYDQLIGLVLRPIYNACTPEEQVSLLETRDELNVTHFFHFEGGAHQENRIRFFNQLELSGAFPMSEFLLLCYERPVETWLDLARLAMTHKRFGSLFWRIALLCPRHAVHHMDKCASSLILDERLLQKPNAQNFLLTLYGRLLILNGLKTDSNSKCYVNLNGGEFPYGREKLKHCINSYLSACAAALGEFGTGPEPNYAILECIFGVLMQIHFFERRLREICREQLRIMELDGSVNPEDLDEARDYAEMHASMSGWRQCHWGLMSQMMRCMDQLRWNLSNFDPERVGLLGIAVKYWKLNMPLMLYVDEDLRRKVTEMALTLSHSDLYVAKELKVQSPNYPQEFIGLVTQASAQEATSLFRRSLEDRRDQAIWSELSKLVEQADCAPAFGAFSFLFRRYMVAFRKHHQRRPKGKQCRVERLMAIVALSPHPIREETRKLAEKMLTSQPGQRAIAAERVQKPLVAKAATH